MAHSPKEIRRYSLTMIPGTILFHLVASLLILCAAAQPPAKWRVMLDKHNAFRANHTAPALTWDPTLAAAAQAYASTCPSGHDPNNGAKRWGENMWAASGYIAAGYTENTAISKAPDSWYWKEIVNYNFATGSKINSNGPSTGHFTQIVWAATLQIGCGVVSGCYSFIGLSNEENDVIGVVCKYAPPGNVLDSSGGKTKYIQNVHRPSLSPAASPAASPRRSPSPARKASPSWSPKKSPAPSPKAPLSPSPKKSPARKRSPLPSPKPSPSPSPKRSRSPSPKPSPSPSPKRSRSHSPKPSPSPSPKRSRSPSPKPSPSPSPKASPPPSPSPGPPASNAPAKYQALVDLHNSLRAVHSSLPLFWDPTMASAAQAYADSCPQASDPANAANGWGENIWFAYGYSEANGLARATRSWYYKYVSNYNFNDPAKPVGGSINTFTQVIWTGTAHIGCGVVTNCSSLFSFSNPNGGPVMGVFCKYSPKGNVMDDSGGYLLYPPNVQPPIVPTTFKVLVGLHNSLRAKHNSQRLVWNLRLAEAAQAYATTCPNADDPANVENSWGENIWTGYGYTEAGGIERASNSWYKYNSNYNYSDPGASSGYIAAFTQLVWNGTLSVGCGVVTGCSKMDGFSNPNGGTVMGVVCKYYPAGNVRDVDGGYTQYLANVSPSA